MACVCKLAYHYIGPVFVVLLLKEGHATPRPPCVPPQTKQP
jgi:hypothetical protein